MIPKITYPETKRVEVVEEHFGKTIANPYRWLENDVRNDKEVAAWVESQNNVTNAYLNTLPGRDIFKNRLKQLYNYERFSIPVKKGGRYFYLHNSGLQSQNVLYVRDSLDSTGRVLIDPNTWAKDGAIALAEWSASDDGKRVAYAVQDADTDDRVVPGHSFKYVAALQAAGIGPKPHFVCIKTRAGHGAGKPTDKIIEETADIWAFAAHWTGLDI